MDATTETAIVERTISIDASPETVWEFFVDPEKLKQWKGIDAKLEPQPGGDVLVRGDPGAHRGRRVRRARPAAPARLHLGLGEERLADGDQARDVDDRGRADARG